MFWCGGRFCSRGVGRGEGEKERTTTVRLITNFRALESGIVLEI